MEAIVGIIIGAFLTYLLTRRSALEDKRTEIRLDAYAALLQSFSDLAAAQASQNREAIGKAKAKIDHARLRVAVAGSKKTTRELALFFRLGGRLDVIFQNHSPV